MRTRVSLFCDRVIEVGWLFALVIVPLFFNIYSSRVFEPDKLSLLRSIALVMATAWLIKTLEGKPEQEGGQEDSSPLPWSRIPLVLPTLLLVAVYLLTTVTSITPRISFWGSYQRLQGTYTTLSYIVIFFLILGNLRRREQLERLVTVVIITSLPISIYGLLQHYNLDPLPWGGDVTARVASNMGNAIFVAAYLIMALFLTLGRLVDALIVLWSEEEAGFDRAVAAGCYLFIVMVQLICIFFTQSRGPWVGLIGGLFFFGLLLALRKGLRRLALAVLTLTVATGLFLILFNLPQSPLAPLREAPYIGRLGKIFEVETGTGKVRVLIWEGAIQLISPHPPLESPLGWRDGLNPLRPLIGYGPESMYVAYNRFYPPDLAHYEARNASPDRSHNETFDALVTTGFIGFLVYMFLFGSIFYYGLKWLGFIETPLQRRLFLGLGLAGAALGVLIPLVLEGTLKFAGVGLPFGFIIGLSLYLALFALLRTIRGEREPTPGLSGRDILLIAVLSAIVAHFIEIHFGIAIAATRTYFWVLAALLVLTGLGLVREEAASPTPTPPPKQKSRRRRRKKKAPSPVQAEPHRLAHWFALSLVMGLILSTMAFTFVTNQGNLSNPLSIVWTSLTSKVTGPGQFQTSQGILWLFAFTWVVGGLVLLTEHRQGSSSQAVSRPYALLAYAVVSLGVFALFALYHASRLRPGEDIVNTIARYYLWTFILLLAVALWLYRERPLAAPFWRGSTAWLYPLLVVGLIIAIYITNVSIVKADIYYKQGLRTDSLGRWDDSIVLYQKAIDLAPDQDFYYLFLGRALLEKARLIPDQAQREVYIEKALDVLRKAQQLNPLNTDHTANLARLYRTWGELSSDQAQRVEKLEKAAHYYEQATSLSPHNAQLFNEWGLVYYLMGDYEGALEKYRQSLELDREFIDTYLLMGDAYMARNELDKAAEVYAQALRLNPTLAHVRMIQGYIYYQQGKLQEAVQEYREVVRISHENLDRLRGEMVRLEWDFSRGAVNLAQVAERRANLQREEEVNRNLLYTARKNLAVLYQLLGRLDEAVVEAQLALDLAPEGEKAALENFIQQLQQEKGG